VSGRGVEAIHVLWIVSVILFVILSNAIHASCHCLGLKTSFLWNKSSRLSILGKCVEKISCIKEV
jgi:hypothetical protein